MCSRICEKLSKIFSGQYAIRFARYVQQIFLKVIWLYLQTKAKWKGVQIMWCWGGHFFVTEIQRYRQLLLYINHHHRRHYHDSDDIDIFINWSWQQWQFQWIEMECTCGDCRSTTWLSKCSAVSIAIRICVLAFSLKSKANLKTRLQIWGHSKGHDHCYRHVHANCHVPNHDHAHDWG